MYNYVVTQETKVDCQTELRSIRVVAGRPLVGFKLSASNSGQSDTWVSAQTRPVVFQCKQEPVRPHCIRLRTRRWTQRASCSTRNEFLVTEPTALVVAKHHELILGIALHSAKVVDFTFSVLVHVIQVIQTATNLMRFNFLMVLIHFLQEINRMAQCVHVSFQLGFNCVEPALWYARSRVACCSSGGACGQPVSYIVIRKRKYKHLEPETTMKNQEDTACLCKSQRNCRHRMFGMKYTAATKWSLCVNHFEED